MDPFLGEIKLFAITFVPKGWHLCDGALLPIAQNQALFALLGTQYGGNGVSTFGLPDLRGRVPVASVPGRNGVISGSEAVTLIPSEVPPHTHGVNVFTAAGNQSNPLGRHIAAPANSQNLYAAAAGARKVALDPSTVSNACTAGNHDNMQPYLVLNYYIATNGVFPQRN